DIVTVARHNGTVDSTMTITPAASLSAAPCFQYFGYDESLLDQYKGRVIEIGRFVKDSGDAINAILAMALAYVASYEYVTDSENGFADSQYICGVTQEHVIRTLKKRGFPVTVIPLSIRPDIWQSDVASHFLTRSVLAGLTREDMNRVRQDETLCALLEQGLASCGQTLDTFNPKEFKVSFFIIPLHDSQTREAIESLRILAGRRSTDPKQPEVSEPETETTPSLRQRISDILRDSSLFKDQIIGMILRLYIRVRTFNGTRRNRRISGGDHAANTVQDQFSGERAYGQTYSLLEQLRVYREMHEWISQQVVEGGFSGRVLDLGAGPALLAELLYRQRNWQGEYVGCDMQPGMVAKAGQRINSLPGSNAAQVRLGKMEDVIAEEPDGSLERVVAAMSIYTLGNWETQRAFLRDLAVKLAIGGRLIMTSPVENPNLQQIYQAHMTDLAARHQAGALSDIRYILEQGKAYFFGKILIGENTKLINRAEEGVIHFPSDDEIRQLEDMGLFVVKQETMYAGQAQCLVLEKRKLPHS
ncbi:MAG TPA: class I SAM-dependent methyltransferase, partial [bacterium]|nr:class I SAM-dependent methyltransferase [bacterium]